MQAIVEDFKALEFYRAWQSKHRIFHHDNQAILRDLLGLLSILGADAIAEAAPHFEKLADRIVGVGAKAEFRLGAERETIDRIQTRGRRCVVYGHTHEPTFAAMKTTREVEDTYLNSGTFRSRVFHTDDRRGFLRVEQMTYLCFFTKDEAKAGWAGTGPAFTAWTGMRTPGTTGNPPG
jgi:UDP-2,3-diacylglucosamine pyrophosphatase LpxH